MKDKLRKEWKYHEMMENFFRDLNKHILEQDDIKYAEYVEAEAFHREMRAMIFNKIVAKSGLQSYR